MAPTKGKNTNENFWQRYAFTYAGAVVAESSTYPIDMTKTRMQLAGEGRRMTGTGALRTAFAIAQAEGVSSLFSGLSPALLRHAIYTPARIVGYEQFRMLLNGGDPSVKLSLWQMGMAGACSGVLGQFVASPADLVKVRMQAAGKNPAAPQYRSITHAFRSIIAQEGVIGLWRGVTPNCQRAALVNLGELATYDAAKQSLLQSPYFSDNIWCHTAASVISGFVSSLVSCPADVLKSRLMANADATRPLYKGTFDCASQIIRTEGVASLWKGFIPSWTRLGPWQLLFWVTYEQLRSLAGIDSF